MESDSLTGARRAPRRARGPPRVSSTLIIGLTLLTLGAIAIGGMVVFRAQQRATAPKQLWINVMTEQQQAQAAAHGKNKSATPLYPGCESTVLLYRHCEKYGPLVEAKHNVQHCSYVGRERAMYIATLFGSSTSSSSGSSGATGTTTSSTRARWPNPSYLYALSPDRGNDHYNYRQVETLSPLATKLGLTIRHSYKEGEELQLAHELLLNLVAGDGGGMSSSNNGSDSNGERGSSSSINNNMCGRVTLVSWTHRSLPRLAAALGCPRFTPERGGCPAVYPVDSFDQVWALKYVYAPTQSHVVLTKHERKQTKRLHEGDFLWTVYPSVTGMNFDPLAFSHTAGDYPDGGNDYGGNWSKYV